jgi:two-component system chemotaxis sensor kinase CheA
VVVFRVAGREAGLLVSEVVDIAREQVEIESEGFRQPGVHGVAIVGGRTVLVLDPYDLVRTIEPEWVGQGPERLDREATVLVAEDTAFFRRQFATIFEEEGLHTVLAEDGAAAFEALERGNGRIDLLVTDVEMPRMNGLELTRRIRSDNRFNHLPIVAVTTLSSSDDAKRGRAAGVDEYLIKLDREQVLDAVRRYLRHGRSG